MHTRFWTALAGLGGAVVTVAAVAGVVTRRNLGWYRRLDRPPWNPPGQAFGPVWAVLYPLMVASALRIWRAPDSAERTRALALWATQLVANGAWTPLFFGARRPRLALGDLGALLATLGGYAACAAKID